MAEDQEAGPSLLLALSHPDRDVLLPDSEARPTTSLARAEDSASLISGKMDFECCLKAFLLWCYTGHRNKRPPKRFVNLLDELTGSLKIYIACLCGLNVGPLDCRGCNGTRYTMLPEIGEALEDYLSPGSASSEAFQSVSQAGTPLHHAVVTGIPG